MSTTDDLITYLRFPEKINVTFQSIYFPGKLHIFRLIRKITVNYQQLPLSLPGEDRKLRLLLKSDLASLTKHTTAENKFSETTPKILKKHKKS